MEGNREEAALVKTRAMEELKNGDKKKAIWLLEKAQRLFPSPDVEHLLSQLNESTKAQPAQNDETNNQPDSENSESSNTQASEKAQQPRLRNGKTTATVEQIELVKRIMRRTDYYEILEVSKSSTTDDIRKAYRKLSLKVHPDKNRAPGSEEAFKAVSEAFEVLSDPSKRAVFDQTGQTQRSALSNHSNESSYYRTHFGADPFDSDEILRAFFGMNHGNAFHAEFGPRTRRRYHQYNSNNVNFTQTRFSFVNLLQILPLLYFIFYFMNLTMPEPVYSLTSQSPYVIEKTSGHGVKYYVSDVNFDTEYPVSSYKRRRIEFEIEIDYKKYLENKCMNEQTKKRQLIFSGYRETANNMKMPNCEEYFRIARVLS